MGKKPSLKIIYLFLSYILEMKPTGVDWVQLAKRERDPPWGGIHVMQLKNKKSGERRIKMGKQNVGQSRSPTKISYLISPTNISIRILTNQMYQCSAYFWCCRASQCASVSVFPTYFCHSHCVTHYDFKQLQCIFESGIPRAAKHFQFIYPQHCATEMVQKQLHRESEPDKARSGNCSEAYSPS